MKAKTSLVEIRGAENSKDFLNYGCAVLNLDAAIDEIEVAVLDLKNTFISKLMRCLLSLSTRRWMNASNEARLLMLWSE